MKEISSLILHNLKKAKGQYASFGIIICLTAFIMNIALVLAFQTGKAYDARFDELNTADINFFIPSVLDNDELKDLVTDIKDVKSAEKHEGVFLSATVKDFADSDFDMNTVFYSLDEKRSVNLLDVDSYSDKGENTVYLPAYITELGGFAAGENITYVIDGENRTYKIGGVVSEMQYGNYGTGLIGGYFPQAAYDKFTEEYESSVITEYSVKTADGADLNRIRTDIADILSDKNIPLLSMSDRAAAKQTRTMVCSLMIVIFLALAAIILLVSIFLSNFRIRNTIDEEMTDMGVLKALGYTSNMIIASAVAPYTIVGSAAAIIGSALSYTILPSVAYILAVQSGFSFTPDFDIAALLLAVLVPAAAIVIFAYIAARKIRALQPINAIRGITGGTADKNRLPLDSTGGSISLLLVLKQIVSSAGQNILLFAVSFGIMVLLSFAGTLLYNVNIKPDNFNNTISEETPSVIYTAREGKLDELKKTVEKDSAVEMALRYAAAPVSYDDGSLTAFVCEDFARVTNDICYEGRNPSSDDEIAVGSALADKYGIGSKIEIKTDDKAYTYKVVGYVQSVNNGGSVCELTEKGYDRINEKGISTLSVYLSGVSAADFISDNEDAYDELVLSEQNYEQLAENGRKLYAGIVSAMTVIIFLISVLIVLLVMYIIINSMITRRRQEFGIYKAIGWSSGQLVVQSAMGFVPVIAVSSVLSAVAGLAYMPAVDNVIFGMVGAMKNHFEVPLWILLIFAVLLTAAGFIISVILASPIKRITAYSLLKE